MSKWCGPSSSTISGRIRRRNGCRAKRLCGGRSGVATAAADREARRSENGWPITPRSSRSRAARYQGRHRQFSLTMRRMPAASQSRTMRHRLIEARRQRLLTEDVLARCRRPQRVVAMGLDRGGDIDRVDRGMIEERRRARRSSARRTRRRALGLVPRSGSRPRSRWRPESLASRRAGYARRSRRRAERCRSLGYRREHRRTAAPRSISS